MLRSVIAAVSESGYRAVTVADIVAPPRFPGAPSTSTSATRRSASWPRPARAASSCSPGPPPRPGPARRTTAEDLLRAAFRGFLGFLADEPAFARVFYLQMPAPGAVAVRRLDAAPRIFANLNQTWHERARRRHPEWPVVPDEAYLALAGATVELVRSMVYADRTDALPELEDTVVALHLAVIAGRPWPAESEGCP